MLHPTTGRSKPATWLESGVAIRAGMAAAARAASAATAASATTFLRLHPKDRRDSMPTSRLTDARWEVKMPQHTPKNTSAGAEPFLQQMVRTYISTAIRKAYPVRSFIRTPSSSLCSPTESSRTSSGPTRGAPSGRMGGNFLKKWTCHAGGDTRLEGDTFVVDTVGTDDRSWVDHFG